LKKEAFVDITERKITKIAREVSKFATRTLRADGVGPSEFDFIHVVRHNPGIAQADVCRILGIDKAAAAREAASLEAKGYLERRQDPEDGRSRQLFATDKAQRLKISKVQIESAYYEWLSSSLSEKDKAEFARILDILYQKNKEESKAGFPALTSLIKGAR